MKLNANSTKMYDYAFVVSTDTEANEIVKFLKMHDHNLRVLKKQKILCETSINGKSIIVIKTNQNSDSSESKLNEVWDDYKFNALIAIGICWAFPQVANLGDLIVFDNVYDFDTVKYYEATEEEPVKTRELTEEFHNSKRSCTYSGSRYIRKFLQLNESFSVCNSNYISRSSGKKVFLGNTLCSQSVVNDSEKRDAIHMNLNEFNMLGGDMESRGIFSFIKNNNLDIPVIVIKSVVDFGGKKGKESKEYNDSVINKNITHNKRHIQRISINIALDFVYNLVSYHECVEQINFKYDPHSIFSAGHFNTKSYMDNLFQIHYFSEISKKAYNCNLSANDKQNLSKYFETFVSFENNGTQSTDQNLIDDLIKVIYSSKDSNVIRIQGEQGVGKSTFMYYLYQYLLDNSHVNNDEFILPIYIEFSNLIGFAESGDDFNKSTIRLLNTIEYYVEFSEIKKIIFLLDSSSEFINESYVYSFMDKLKRTQLKNEIGLIDTSFIVCENVSRFKVNQTKEMFAHEIKFNRKAIPEITDIYELVNNYCKISDLPNVEDSKEDVIELLLSKKNDYSKNPIDFFTLHLYFYLKDENLDQISSTVELYEKFLYKLIWQQIGGHNQDLFDETLLNASKYAFKHFIKGEDITADDKMDGKLIHRHSSLTSLLIANYVAHLIKKITKSNAQETFDDIFSILYHSEMCNAIDYFLIKKKCKTEFIKHGKSYIKKSTSDENFLMNENTNRVTVLANLVYFISKLLKENSNIRQYNSIRNQFIEILTLLLKNPRSKYDPITILLVRTIYITLIFRLSPNCENELDKLIYDYMQFIMKYEHRIRVHINYYVLYYSDDIRLYNSELDKILREDQIYSGSLDYLKVINHLFIELKESFLREPNSSYLSFTLILFYIRYYKDLNSDLIESFKQTISRIKKIYSTTRKASKIEILRIIDDIDNIIGKDKEFEIINSVIQLRYTERNYNDYSNVGSFQKIESIAEHQNIASILAMILLKESNEYDKSKIVRMLTFHDMEKYFDFIDLNNKVSDQSNPLSLQEFSRISLRKRVNGLFDIYDLCNEFNECTSSESKVANDINKIEKFIQLNNHYRSCNLIQNTDLFADIKHLKEGLVSNIGQELFESIYDYLFANICIYNISEYQFSNIESRFKGSSSKKPFIDLDHLSKIDAHSVNHVLFVMNGSIKKLYRAKPDVGYSTNSKKRFTLKKNERENIWFNHPIDIHEHDIENTLYTLEGLHRIVEKNKL